MIAIVKTIELNDSDIDKLYSITCTSNSSTSKVASDIIAYPLDINIKRVPVVGELVYILQSPSSDAKGSRGTTLNYYITSVSLQKNINHNVLPKSVGSTFKGSSVSDYSKTETGNPNANSEKDFEFQNGFDEIPKLSALQPFSGDILIEGRFGQSIRLGYTPKDSKVTQSPSWNSSDALSPITIFRNTTNGGGYNKFVIEDVNKDDSSIYMTSNQRVDIEPASDFPNGIKAPNSYNERQIIVTSGRLHLNAKDDNVILTSEQNVVLSSKEDVKITTSDYDSSLNIVITDIYEILDDLTSSLVELAKGTYPTAVGPTGPHPSEVSNAPQILQKVKQKLNGIKK